MGKPNFFIVGAPKCGTTALSQYLQEHKNVFFCTPKEPAFFCKEIKPKCRQINTLERYLHCFKNVCHYHTAIGEGSTRYFSCAFAIKSILKFNSQAKFIAMVRNPIDMFFSLHADHYFTHREKYSNPEKAWKEADSGNNVRKFFSDKLALNYKRMCKLGEQASRLFDVVPKENIHVIVYDDFKIDTKKVYIDVLNFLGISYDGRIDFPKVNIRKYGMNKYIGAIKLFLKNIRSLKTKYAGNVRLPKPFFSYFINKVEDISNVHARAYKGDVYSEEFIQELKNYFEPDVLRLSKLIDRDLTHWIYR